MSPGNRTQSALLSGYRARYGIGFALAARIRRLLEICQAAWAVECAERRLFLWLPVAAGAGVLLYLSAEREPSLWFVFALCLLAAGGAFLVRGKQAIFAVFMLAFAFWAGFFSAGWRTARVAAPVIDHIRIMDVEGIVETFDRRADGARFVMRVGLAVGSNGNVIDYSGRPLRVRLSARGKTDFAAGDRVRVRARVLPPSQPSIPGGYSFARDAYFSGLGAVGSTLGPVTRMSERGQLGWRDWFWAGIDHIRDQLAERVSASIGGQEGAIAAAMVTGKRMLLNTDSLELIRQAGIFHIITISGIQMTLVAGIIFWFSRRLLAQSEYLALYFPIKKLAAIIAIVASVFYDLGTGSRVGTERALLMTIIMLGAILWNRSALTMRNLALAVVVVIALEPEVLTGASFQLSFAAVAALVAVHEQRYARTVSPADKVQNGLVAQGNPRAVGLIGMLQRSLKKVLYLLLATVCATSATASFMAADFHELSPYVAIGNPLTMAIIEFFAVPAALIGTLLYPLGLDGLVWTYLGLGIRLVLAMARVIASLPGASLHVHAFAGWALPFLTLAILNMVIWRTWVLRLLALPCAIAGLCGAAMGAPFDIIVPPSGDFIAVRQADGRLAIAGRHVSEFAANQWLTADADGRTPSDAMSLSQSCDALGCVMPMGDDKFVSIVYRAEAFEEDCRRAALIVSPLVAPPDCAAGQILDRNRLAKFGASTLSLSGLRLVASERSIGTDRPWLPRIPVSKSYVVPAPELETNDPAGMAAQPEDSSSFADPAFDDSGIELSR